MSRGFDPYLGYGKGKSKDKNAWDSQRSSPRAMLPRAAVTPVELGKQVMTVKLHDGRTVRKLPDVLYREKLLERALKGNMAAARELYAHLDAEIDSWMAEPRYKVPRGTPSKKQLFGDLMNQLLFERRALEALGIIAKIEDSTYCIMPWVKEAYERHIARDTAANDGPVTGKRAA